MQGFILLNTQNKLKYEPHIYIFVIFKKHFSKHEFKGHSWKYLGNYMHKMIQGLEPV